MTRQPQYFSKTAFSEWLHNHGPSSVEMEDAVDIQDIDFVIFSYLTGELMTIEAKERNGQVRGAQKDTQNILRQLLILGSCGTVNTKRGVRPIKYSGHHLIQFQNTTPDDGWVKLNGKLIERDDLLNFLNFGRVIRRKFN